MTQFVIQWGEVGYHVRDKLIAPRWTHGYMENSQYFELLIGN